MKASWWELYQRWEAYEAEKFAEDVSTWLEIRDAAD